MEITQTQKNVSHTPRKMRLVADMIRRLTPLQALQDLRFVNKAAAPDLAKAIKTALANAKQLGLAEGVMFKKLEINEGVKMKRYRSAARGRVRPYVKRTSHIKIVLTDDLNVKPEKEKSMSEKKGGNSQSGSTV